MAQWSQIYNNFRQTVSWNLIMISFSISTSRFDSYECQDLRSSTIELFQSRSIASRGHYCITFCRSWTDTRDMPPRPTPDFPSKTHNALLPNTHNGSKHVILLFKVWGRGLAVYLKLLKAIKRGQTRYKKGTAPLLYWCKNATEKNTFSYAGSELHLCRLFWKQKRRATTLGGKGSVTPVFVSADLKLVKWVPALRHRQGNKIISRSSSVVSFSCCAFHWRNAPALTSHHISRRLLDSTCRSLLRLLPPDRLPLSGGRGQRCAHSHCVYLATVHQAGRDYGCWARVTGCYWQAYLLPTDCQHAAVCWWRAAGPVRRCYVRPWSVYRWRQAAGRVSFWECVRHPSGYCPVECVPQEVLGFPLLSPACGSDPGAVLGAGACCPGLLRGCRSLQSPLVSASSCLGSSVEENRQMLLRTKKTANVWSLAGEPYLVLVRTPGGRTRRASLRLLNSESNNPKTRLTQQPSHTLVLMSGSVHGYLLTDCATLCLLPLAWSCSLSRWTNEWAARGTRGSRVSALGSHDYT